MKTPSLALVAFVAALIFGGDARAQEKDAPRLEVGAHFSSFSFEPPETGGWITEPGFGGRITYNLTDSIALEAETNFFPHKNFSSTTAGGRIVQGQFGVKAGKRYEKFGIYAKARPGFVSFGDVVVINGVFPDEVNGVQFQSVDFDIDRRTHFSTDVGGVLEFYPSRRIVARFDAGDTIIRYGSRKEVAPLGFGLPLTVVQTPSQTKHNFQFTAGVAFRFMDPAGDGAADTDAPDLEDTPRFEVGVQFTSLSLGIPRGIFSFPVVIDDGFGPQTEPGFGGRITYNLNDNFALEAEGNFFTTRSFSNSTFGGHPFQGQFGVKAGKRYGRFGVFAKARPGFVGFSEVRQLVGTTTVLVGTTEVVVGDFRDKRKEYFSTDVGGVLEFYPSRRVLTRLDFGDTIIRYGDRSQQGFFLSTPIIEVPAETKHNFQFSAGIGLRF